MKKVEERIKISRRDAVSGMWMTLKIAFRAGKGGGILNALLSLVDAVVSPINAVLEGALITAIVGSVVTQDFWPVLWISLAIVLLRLLTSLANRFADLTHGKVWQAIRAYADEMMALKYAGLPLVVRESKEGSELFERAEKYRDRIASISTDAVRMAGNFVGFVVAFIALVIIAPWLAIIVVVATVPLAVVEYRQMKKSETDWRKFYAERRKSWLISEMLLNKDESFEMEVNGMTGYFAKLMVKLRQAAVQKDLERDRKFFWPRYITDAVEALVVAGLLVYVAIEIMLGRLAIGQFVTIRALIDSLSFNAAAAFRGVSSIGSDLIGANDFAAFMKLPERADGAEVVPLDVVPRIEFRNVRFKYPTSENYALDDISFVIEPGEDVAVVGENGAGKSTLIKLLLGAYEPESGEILVNDIPLGKLKRREYLRQVGSLLQQFNQYNFASLGENVWYGDVRKRYSAREVRAALVRAGAEGMEGELAGGLDQVLSREFDEKNGANLSGGQWQKVALARSFYRNPNILVLDEPTSAIDAKAEYAIFREIMESQKDKTTIIISHRFSTVRKAEKILVMERGKMTQQGTHMELVAEGGLYREMFELQAEGYK